MIEEFINSGILELYVMGTATAEESAEVQRMASLNSIVRSELESITHAMDEYAKAHAVEPDITVKPFLMAMIDYTERLKNGELPTVPPMLNEDVGIEDFTPWLTRKDMVLAENFDGIYLKIIGNIPEVTTAIVWLGEMAPQEVHHDEYEKFLIVEGTCEIIIEEKIKMMKPGDYFSIPLHKRHSIKVTSDIPCKIILQRMAA